MPIPPHIARLLERTELPLVPAVAVLVRGDDGRVLPVHNVEGFWTLPGGLLEPDERPDDAAARERCEESSLTVRVGRVLGVFGGPVFRSTFVNGDRIATMSAIFAADVVTGSPRPDGVETDAAGWFGSAEALSLELSARTRVVLEAPL